MDRVTWERWRDAPPGDEKKRLEAKLLADNDKLARYYVAGFSTHSAYYTDNMQDDLLQAARIGILRALSKWDPDKGGFSAVGYQWARHEMQQVARHASRISVPKSAFLPKAKQDEIAKFEAIHGRSPLPSDVGLTQKVFDRVRMATVEIVEVEQADSVEVDTENTPEFVIDRKRDAEALNAYIRTLSPRDRREFWAGSRPDLTEAAKRYIEDARVWR